MYGNNSGGFGGPRRFAPVRVGEEIDVRIEAVGEKGDGIAKKKGFVLFVPNTSEGDEVRVRVSRVLKKVGFAEVICQAQGPIEDSSKPAPKQEKKEEAPAEEEDIPEGDESETFGEESDSSTSESDESKDSSSSDSGDDTTDKDMDLPPEPEEEQQ